MQPSYTSEKWPGVNPPGQDPNQTFLVAKVVGLSNGGTTSSFTIGLKPNVQDCNAQQQFLYNGHLCYAAFADAVSGQINGSIAMDAAALATNNPPLLGHVH